MKKIINKFFVCVLMLSILLVAPISVLAEITNENEATEQALLEEIDAMLAEPCVPGEIVFFMENGITLDEASDILGEIGVPNDFDDENVYIYRSDTETLFTNEELWFTINVEETQIRNILYELRTCPSVRTASPNMIYEPVDVSEQLAAIDAQVAAEASAPLEGYDSNTTPLVMDNMGVAAAWKAGFKGSSNVIVAVLDTGFTAHTDIDVITTGIYPTTNKACVNTALARNTYVSNSQQINDAYGYNYTDSSGHGTFIIGQIGAKLNDSHVNGICQAVTIVPIKISTEITEIEEVDGVETEVINHYSNTSSTARGARYAQSIGASVLNLSFEVGDTDAYNIIAQEGFDGLFVVAAGNHGVVITPDNDEVSALANNNSKWIVVGNLWSDDFPSPTSNKSSLYVDLFAYGSLIQGCGLQNDIVTMSGTSMAAPHVTAAAALIMSHATHLSVEDVRQLLIDTAVPIERLEDSCVSGGRLSIINAVNALYSASRPAYSKGDVNGDGKVDSKDYLRIKRIVLGTYTANSSELQGADINGDGNVNTQDYLMAKRHVLRTYYCPPV